MLCVVAIVIVTQPSQDAVENNCPLHVSCFNGHTDIVMLLVNHPDIKINQQVCSVLYSMISLNYMIY